MSVATLVVIALRLALIAAVGVLGVMLWTSRRRTERPQGDGDEDTIRLGVYVVVGTVIVAALLAAAHSAGLCAAGQSDLAGFCVAP
jgi:predicted membrane channel-forming protein YqfA (hemolysin III family)